MSSFVLWDPSEPHAWDDPGEFSRVVARTAAGRTCKGRWSISVNINSHVAGMQVFMLRTRRERGIVGSGLVVSDVPYVAPNWNGPGSAMYVDIAWDAMVDPVDRLDRSLLTSKVGGLDWRGVRASGAFTYGGGEAILRLWNAHIGRAPEAARVLTSQRSELLWEGAARRSVATRYERSRVARQRCIDYYGAACVVCGFDFSATYGASAAGIIQVHHLAEVASKGKQYSVDPVKDLRPVCPNCHVMLHTESPPLTPADLRRRLKQVSATGRA